MSGPTRLGRASGVHNRAMAFDLVVYRANAFMLKRRKFRVEVDGVAVGKLKPGGKLSVDLDEGEHDVRVVVGAADSKIVKVLAGPSGSGSLVAMPADTDPAARTERLARRDRFGLTLIEGDDVSRVGPSFREIYSSRPRSTGNPARGRTQRMLWLFAMALALIGFVLLPLVRNGVGFAFLAVAVLIGGCLQIGVLIDRRKSGGGQ
jgi:hypothetical protein